MPELPEVEAARRVAERVARGRRIVDVWCADDPIVFERIPATRWRRALLGRRVGAVKRHGKHLWFELDRRPWPCMHFGMTGGFHTPGRGTLRLVAHGKKGPGLAWPPYQRERRSTMLFDRDIRVVNNPRAEFRSLIRSA